MRRSVLRLAQRLALGQTQAQVCRAELFAACNAVPPSASAITAAREMSKGINRGFGTSSDDSSSNSDTEEWVARADMVNSIFYSPSEVKVGKPAPDFTVMAVVDNEFKKVSLKDYLGQYVVLFFYPKDFTFVCPTEIIAFNDRVREFEALGAQVLAVSCDSEEVHLAWMKTPRNRGGLGHMEIPLLADTTKAMANKYGVLIEESGVALRGLFIIDPEGIVQQMTINSLPVGRSVDETLRLLQALQYVAAHGEVCPAGWKPGDKTMVADPDRSLDYFSSVNSGAAEESATYATKLTPITTRKEFEAAISGDKPAVIDFFAPWCGKCRQIAPLMDELVEQYPNVAFYKLDTTCEPVESVVTDLGVKALPAFRFFKNGQEALPPVVGYKKRPLRDAVVKLNRP